MEIFRLGNIEVIPNAFFIRDEINAPLCLENSFGNLVRVLPVLNEEKTEEQIGRHVASKRKEDEFEGINVTNFGCLLGMDLLGKKARPSRDSVLEFWSSDASCSERDRFFAYLPSGRLC